MKILKQLRIISSVTLGAIVFAAGYAKAADSFEDFRVVVDRPSADSVSVYHLSFSLSNETYARLNNGRLSFEFPDGFGLGSVVEAKIESDHPGRQYEVDRISIDDGNRLVLRLERVDDDDDDDEDKSGVEGRRINVQVNIASVRNSGVAGEYRLRARAYKDGDRIAGPSWSESFEITEESQDTKAELQIVSTELVAPNSPRVNTNQEVEVEVLVANVSNKTAHNNIVVGLISNGSSIINSPKSIELLEPNDTAKISFEVTASSEPGEEYFEADILSNNGLELEAVDNAATAIIQTPARLELSSSIPDGDSLFVTWDEPYSFSFLIENLGESSVGRGRYHIMSIDSLGEEGHFGFYIVTGVPVKFDMRARPFDHILYINFEITETPVDSNTGKSAIIDDKSISFAIVIRQAVRKPFEQSFIVQNNPFNPNDGPVSFVYNLSGASDVEFRIFTVTGEEVYSRTYLSGTEGGKTGTNQIQWDGRNNAGEMVLNGVYITSVEVTNTGETAFLKLAVLK